MVYHNDNSHLRKPLITIVALLQCLQAACVHNNTASIQLCCGSAVVMTGRVTMVGISRWARSGSLITGPSSAFFSQALPWAMLFGCFVSMSLPF